MACYRVPMTNWRIFLCTLLSYAGSSVHSLVSFSSKIHSSPLNVFIKSLKSERSCGAPISAGTESLGYCTH